MKSQFQFCAILNIAAGALYLLAAAGVFLFLGLTGTIVMAQGEGAWAGLIGVVAIAIVIFLAVLGLPSVIGGWALLKGKSWAKPLLLVLSVLHLPNIPLGTALGIYTLVVLLAEESQPQITARPLQPDLPRPA